MPMNDPRILMREYTDIAGALCDWFVSQQIAPGRAVGVMSFLIGIMAAEIAVSESEAMEKLNALQVATKMVCRDAMRVK